MRIEKLSKGRKKKVILAITILVLLIGIIYITNSRAKYQVTSNIQIVKCKVNYKSYDFQILSMYKEENGEDVSIETMPNANDYEIDIARSYCENGSVRNNNAILKTINGNHTIANLNKLDKCYLYFEKITSEDVLANLKLSVSESGCPAYENPAISGVEASQSLICKGQDDDGNTYYFRGKADNNWVKFADYYWRIIRINGDGSIRIIYNGTSPEQTGEETRYRTGKFNMDSYKAEFVGFKYTLESRNGYGRDSSVLGTLNTFYTSQLLSYANNIDLDAGFCGDRTSTTTKNATTTDNTGGTGTTPTYYGGYIRINLTRKATFKCPDIVNDLYTKIGSIKGNKSLTNPIGLITADEVMYAGGSTIDNTTFWLCTNNTFMTMSPSWFSETTAFVYLVNSSGRILYNSVNFDYDVRPVINLKAGTQFDGSGISSDPYVVQ